MPAPTLTNPRSLLARHLAALLLALGPLAASPAVAGPHGHPHHAEASRAPGRLYVDNDRGETVLVEVDGRSQGAVAPHRVESFVLPAGSHYVLIRDLRGRVLEQDTVHLSPRGAATVEIERVYSGRLVVDNPLDRPVELHVDGRRLALLAPFARDSLALPAGTVRVELVLPGGRVVASGTERLSPHQVASWSPHPALVGELILDNPLPIAVLVSDARGRSWTLRPGARVELRDLPEGPHRFVATRLDGPEVVGELRAHVEAFEAARAAVPAPRTGVLVVGNARHRAVEVRVDGRSVALAGALAETRLELAPGVHRVELVSTRSGRVVEVLRVEVDRYAARRIEVPERHYGPGGWDDDDRDELSVYFGGRRGVELSATIDLD